MFLGNVAHYLTSLVVLLKGFDKIEQGKVMFGLVFSLIGLIILFGTIFHHRFEKRLRHFKAWVFALEAISISIVGYLYMKDGKQFIQYVCFASSIIFVVAIIIYFKKAKSTPAPH